MKSLHSDAGYCNQLKETERAVIENAMATGSMVQNHPLLQFPLPIRKEYCKALDQLLRSGRIRNNIYVSKQFELYNKLLTETAELGQSVTNSIVPWPLLPIDFVHLIGYNRKILARDMIDNLIAIMESKYYVPAIYSRVIVSAAMGNRADIDRIEKQKETTDFGAYMAMFIKNIRFLYTLPFRILVAGNMSAGKSTTINALVGKQIVRAQNMVCTSRMYCMIGQPFESGMVQKLDSDYLPAAMQQELMCETEPDMKNAVSEAAYFQGLLGGQRIVLIDTPGINSSQHPEHKALAEEITQQGKYDLIVAVLDATQLHTTGMSQFIEELKAQCSNKPVVFLMNKVDAYYREEYEDLYRSIEKLRRELSKRFSNPTIYPVSASAGFISKCGKEYDLEVIKMSSIFKKLDLNRYYNVEQSDTAEEKSRTELLYRSCGLFYVEKAIERIIQNQGGSYNA